MEICKNRPLFVCELVFVAGTLCAAFFEKAVSVWMIPVGALLFLFCFLRFRRKKSRVRLVLCLCAFAIFLSGGNVLLRYRMRNETFESYVGKSVSLQGTVIERKAGTTYDGAFYFSVTSFNGEKRRAKVIVECAFSTAAQCGDELLLTVTPRAFSSEDEYDEKLQYLSDGYDLICVCASSEDCTGLGKSTSLSVTVHRFRDALTGKLLNALGRESGGMAAALLLGNRSFVSVTDKLHFSRVGVSHLLALSGFHATLIVFFLDLILRGFRIRFVPRAAITAVLMLCYLLLTGLSPSTVRAVLMLCTLEIGRIVRREYDSLTALGGVLCAILLVTPYAVNDLSLWLSFLATAGILIFIPLAEPLKLRLRKRLQGIPLVIVTDLLIGLLAGTCAVTAISLFSALVFGSLSILSIPLTLFYTVPVGTVLVLSALYLVCPIAPLADADWAVVTFLRRSAQLFAESEGGYAVCSDAVSYGLLVLTTVALLLLAVLRIKKKGWFLIPPILWCAAFLSCLVYPLVGERNASGEYVNTTSGDLLFFSQRGQCVAVNFTDGLASGATALRNLAEENHCADIDRLIFTHYHNRDTNFLVSLSGKILVRELWLPEPLDDGEQAMANRIVEIAENAGMHCYFGNPEKLVGDLCLLENNHTETKSSRHTGLLFSVEWNGKTLTYLNASAPDSALFEAVRDDVADADCLILGKTGFSKSGNKHLLPKPKSKCEIVFSSEKSATLFEDPPSGTVADRYRFSFP